MKMKLVGAGKPAEWIIQRDGKEIGYAIRRLQGHDPRIIWTLRYDKANLPTDEEVQEVNYEIDRIESKIKK